MKYRKNIMECWVLLISLLIATTSGQEIAAISRTPRYIDYKYPQVNVCLSGETAATCFSRISSIITGHKSDVDAVVSCTTALLTKQTTDITSYYGQTAAVSEATRTTLTVTAGQVQALVGNLQSIQAELSIATQNMQQISSGSSLQLLQSLGQAFQVEYFKILSTVAINVRRMNTALKSAYQILTQATISPISAPSSYCVPSDSLLQLDRTRQQYLL